MPHQTTVLPFGEFRDIVGPHCNPHLTVAVAAGDTPDGLRFTVGEFANGLAHDRVMTTVEYLSHMRQALPSGDTPMQPFLFQAEDVPAEVASVSWEARREWKSVMLVPDLYYYTGGGYEHWLPVQIPWRARQTKAVWRGSTTGLFYFSADDLDRLPRYRLCHAVAKIGNIADVGLTAVVQTADQTQARQIESRLNQEGLFKPFLPMEDMTAYRYVLDIDGNSNSWNFMMKLRLGACVLRVDSDWKQWFCERLRPWEHYVPIAKDLSNVADIVQWCLDHDDECEAIAARGFNFAKEMRFSDEMARAANSVYRAAER